MGRRILPTVRRLLDAATAYTYDTASFDGSTYLTGVEATLGLTNGKAATVAFGIKLLTDSTNQYVLGSGNSRFYIYIDSSNLLQVVGKNTASTTILNIRTDAAAFTADGNWHTVMFNFDLATAVGGSGTFAIYIDGSPVAASILASAFIDDSIDFTRDWFLGSQAGATFLNACLANFTFDAAYYDLATVGSNIVSSGDMLNPDVAGDSSYTSYFGTKPDVLLIGSGTGFYVNSGTGGDFTDPPTAGTLTTCA